jgi:hypothetical protein
MSTSYIPEKTKIRLWGKAAGRCQYRGCNEPLWYDGLTKAEFNISYIAHIVADSPGGPRGDSERSELLSRDIENLMLMCDSHHRLIDREQVEEHPEELLLEMKQEHERKMELLTSLTEDRQSHVLLYGANIGKSLAKLSKEKAYQAMIPNKYPAEINPIELSLGNSSFIDNEKLYWEIERENLNRMFNERVLPRLQTSINHLSVFALAPQPLLIELGRLITDLKPADVYQPHRVPDHWGWELTPENFEYKIFEPEIHTNLVALNISLSGTIDNSRIRDVLGPDVSVWTITIDTPNNEFLRSREQLSGFVHHFKFLLDVIKKKYGQKNEIHIFPAAPVAINIEMGRAWMPKADLPLKLYDQNKEKNQFEYAFCIE